MCRSNSSKDRVFGLYRSVIRDACNNLFIYRSLSKIYLTHRDTFNKQVYVNLESFANFKILKYYHVH